MRLRILCWGGWRSPLRPRRPPWQRTPMKIGFITKFPVPFYFQTMEDAAKEYAAGASGRGDHLRSGNVGHRHRGADRAHRDRWLPRACRASPSRRSIRPWRPALDKAVAAGVKVVLMDNSIPDWKGQTVAGDHEQLQRRQDRRRVSEDGPQGRRQDRHPRGGPRRARPRRSGEGDAGGAEGRQRRRRRQGRDQLHRGARDQRRPGHPDGEPGHHGDLLGVRSARRRCRAGDQERQPGSSRHPGRLRFLLRRAGSDRRRRTRTPRWRSSRPRWRSLASMRSSRPSTARRWSR